MKRKGWFIPILVFIISMSVLFGYQKKVGIDSFANTTNLPPILWSLSSSDIHKVIYKQSDQTIEAIRENDTWMLAQPLSSKADALYVYNAISAFIQPIFIDIIELEPQNLTIYGIDEFSPTISLLDAENTVYTLVKGSEYDSLHNYVYSPLSNTVYTMPKAAFENISIDSSHWRSKELLNCSLEDIQKIDLVYGGHHISLLGEYINDAYTFSSPQLDDYLVDDFINFLQTSKIQTFITDDANEHVLSVYGFNKPLLECKIYLSSGSVMQLTIGDVNEKENACYVRLNNSNSIFTIPYFNLSQLNTLYSTLQGNKNLNTM